MRPALSPARPERRPVTMPVCCTEVMLLTSIPPRTAAGARRTVFRCAQCGAEAQPPFVAEPEVA